MDDVDSSVGDDMLSMITRLVLLIGTLVISQLLRYKQPRDLRSHLSPYLSLHTLTHTPSPSSAGHGLMWVQIHKYTLDYHRANQHETSGNEAQIQTPPR